MNNGKIDGACGGKKRMGLNNLVYNSINFKYGNCEGG
jgi:hypothetical protein